MVQTYKQPSFDDMVPREIDIEGLVSEIEDESKGLKNPSKIPGDFNISELSPRRFFDNELPEIQWIIYNMLAKGIVGFMYGEGGSFKSLAAMWLVMQMACAKIHSTQKWLDKFPVPFGRAIFFSAEDVELDLHLRVIAIAKEMAKQRPDIPEAAFIDAISKNCLIVSRQQWAADGEPFIVDEHGKKTNKVEKIISLTKEFGADLIILETFSRIANVDEIDNKQGARVVGTLEDIRDATGVTVQCIAHSGKVARSLQTDTHGQNGMRGAGALMDNARHGIWFRAQKAAEDGTAQIEVVNSKTFRCKRFESFIISVEYPSFLTAKREDVKPDMFSRVVEHIKENPGIKQREVIKAFGGKAKPISDAFKDAISEGLIELRGPKNRPEGYFYVD